MVRVLIMSAFFAFAGAAQATECHRGTIYYEDNGPTNPIATVVICDGKVAEATFMGEPASAEISRKKLILSNAHGEQAGTLPWRPSRLGKAPIRLTVLWKRGGNREKVVWWYHWTQGPAHACARGLIYTQLHPLDFNM